MIKCAECGYENMDGLDYCDGCGAKLAAAAPGAAAPAPSDGAPADTPNAEAPSSGGALSESRFIRPSGGGGAEIGSSHFRVEGTREPSCRSAESGAGGLSRGFQGQ